jgi:peptidoglycan/LPS O-acetylase OafA/YrhL
MDRPPPCLEKSKATRILEFVDRGGLSRALTLAHELLHHPGMFLPTSFGYVPERRLTHPAAPESASLLSPGPAVTIGPPCPKAGGAAPGRHSPEGHVAQLDGLRGLAVLAVLLHHTIPAANRLNLGGLGVQTFFVLSGFLITGILLRARAQAQAAGQGRRHVIRSFYARRFLRIFPLYYAVLFAAALLTLPLVRETFFWHLGYLSNYYSAFHPVWPEKPINHLWSLSVEEQFYLVWPVLVLLTPLRRLPWVLSVMILAAPRCRAVVLRIDPHITGGAFTIACLDTLGAGALLAWLEQRKSEGDVIHDRLARFGLWAGLALAAVMLALRILDKGWSIRQVLEETSYMLLALWVVDRAIRGFRGVGKAVLEFRPLVYLGTISYGAYVYHEFIPPWSRKSRAPTA